MKRAYWLALTTIAVVGCDVTQRHFNIDQVACVDKDTQEIVFDGPAEYLGINPHTATTAIRNTDGHTVVFTGRNIKCELVY